MGWKLVWQCWYCGFQETANELHKDRWTTTRVFHPYGNDDEVLVHVHCKDDTDILSVIKSDKW